MVSLELQSCDLLFHLSYPVTLEISLIPFVFRIITAFLHMPWSILVNRKGFGADTSGSTSVLSLFVTLRSIIILSERVVLVTTLTNIINSYP